jgi:large subunit ribosomal protein L21
MHAVIISGGKQYLVKEGQVLKLEKLSAAVGDIINFTEVLMVGGDDITPNVGQPYVAGCVVEAAVVEHKRYPKIKIIKFKRRKHHLKQLGHRQHYTAVQIVKIKS